MNISIQEELEALLQFLYLAPVGLMQTRLDGEIVMVNPLCAQLLMPLASGGVFTNLYGALGDLVPDLRTRVDEYEGASGMVCEGLLLHVFGNPARPATTRRILSLTVLKLGANGLMAVLNDVTSSVQRDRELRQSQAWINTIAIGLTDYALTTLDGQGHVRDWTSSVERVTGFNEAASIGQPYSIFYPPEALDVSVAVDRLHEADCSGWSLDEGWRRRADGSRYWGSCLIAPLHEAGEKRLEAWRARAGR